MTKARDLANVATNATDAANALPETIINAAGDLIYGTANDTATRLAIGTAGQVLQVNSGATAPEWVTAASGGMTLISTINASAATSISFTAIPNTYKHLLLVWEDCYQNSSSDVYWFARFNNDSDSDYRIRTIYRTSGALLYTSAYEGGIGGAYQRAVIGPTANGDDVEGNSFGRMWIYDYANTTTYKHFDYTSHSRSVGGNAVDHWVWAYGSYQDSGNAAIDRVDLIRSSTQTLTGTFKLYGVS